MPIAKPLFLSLYVALGVKNTPSRPLIDTGYNGFLTLPPDLIELLGLPFLREQSRHLGRWQHR